jgi:hypothetical protein
MFLKDHIDIDKVQGLANMMNGSWMKDGSVEHQFVDANTSTARK